MTPAQCRAARAMVNWSAEQLASAAGVSLSTIRNFERGASVPIANNLSAIQRALEAAGVMFVENGAASPNGGAGVRLRHEAIPTRAGSVRAGDRLVEYVDRSKDADGG